MGRSLDPVEALQQQVLPGRIKQLPHHRPREVAVGLLDQQAVAEIEHVAVEREAVAVLVPRRLVEQQRRLPDQVEREIGETEIDLDRRRMAAPFAEPLPEDQRIVAEPKQVIRARRDLRLLARLVERSARADACRNRFVFGPNGGKGWHFKPSLRGAKRRRNPVSLRRWIASLRSQ